MRTNSLVTLIKKQFPDWSRVMILEMINEVQKIVFTQTPTRQMLVRDPDTGKDPVITVSGVAEFPVPSKEAGFPADVWRVSQVYSSSIDEPLDVICYDSSVGEPAKIVFPSVTTGAFHVRTYRYPTKIESEDDQLEIPESFHITHVLNGVCGLIEQTRSGKSDRWDFFLQRQVNDLVKKMSNGKGPVSSFVPLRGY